jgi:hypothetical protein
VACRRFLDFEQGKPGPAVVKLKAPLFNARACYPALCRPLGVRRIHLISKASSYPLSVISVDNDGELSRGVLCHETALFFEFGASASRYYRGSVRVASERPQWRLAPDVQTASSDNDERPIMADLGRSSPGNAGFEPGGRGFESRPARQQWESRFKWLPHSAVNRLPLQQSQC